MVQYNPKTWISIVFHSYSRFVVKTMLPVLIFMTVFTTIVCLIMLEYFGFNRTHFQNTTALHSLLGIVLGLFLVFRTNSAYDRWWEGRKLWGMMVNSTRNYALKLQAYLDKDDRENRMWFAQMIPNFVIATKEHLRKGVQLSELEPAHPGFAEALERYQHKPNGLSAMLYSKVNELYKTGKLTPEQFWVLDKEMKDFIDIMGACERIKNTPIPYSYAMFIKKFIFIYIITLPFGFVTSFEYVTIPTTLLLTFVLLSVELIAEEIEDPFGRDTNDLPTDLLSEKIRENVREVLL
ncbi:MAG TPA: bestrophin family protein [Cyclobacteriaceae bacterium]|nr:bestrophin family protein [Cyclobacteriaceae bacterium]